MPSSGWLSPTLRAINNRSPTAGIWTRDYLRAMTRGIQASILVAIDDGDRPFRSSASEERLKLPSQI